MFGLISYYILEKKLVGESILGGKVPVVFEQVRLHPLLVSLPFAANHVQENMHALSPAVYNLKFILYHVFKKKKGRKIIIIFAIC